MQRLVVGFKNYVADLNAGSRQRTLFAQAINAQPATFRDLYAAGNDVSKTRDDDGQRQPLHHARAGHFAADEIEGEEEGRAAQAFDADDLIVGKKGRDDAAGEETEQRQVNRRAANCEFAVGRHLHGPGRQADEKRALRDSNRMWREQCVQRQREEDDSLGDSGDFRLALGGPGGGSLVTQIVSTSTRQSSENYTGHGRATILSRRGRQRKPPGAPL